MHHAPQLVLVASLLTAIFLTRCALIIKNMVNDTTSGLWWFDPVRPARPPCPRIRTTPTPAADPSPAAPGPRLLPKTYYILLELFPVVVMLYVFRSAPGQSRMSRPIPSHPMPITAFCSFIPR